MVDIDKSIDISKINVNDRVALRNDSYALHLVLPSKVDPLVSLMKVEKVPDSTYDMVGGCDKQIKEIKEVIELPIKHPELFESLGIAQPKGVLMYGPPGTGKTLLARAVAHHTDCTFIRVSGGELVQKYIGEGSRMVRELFVMAREHSPSIIFMDEIDSIGGARQDGESGGDSEVPPCSLAYWLSHITHSPLTLRAVHPSPAPLRVCAGAGATDDAGAAEPAGRLRGHQPDQGCDGHQPHRYPRSGAAPARPH